MAISQSLPVNRSPLYGDGVATRFSIDFSKDLAASLIQAGRPDALYDLHVSDTSGSPFAVVAATLHGNSVEIELETAPPAGVPLALGFQALYNS
jgi:hypothetical protein